VGCEKGKGLYFGIKKAGKPFFLLKTGNNKKEKFVSCRKLVNNAWQEVPVSLDVSKPAVVRDIMNHYGISCRKSLGQNFLVDRNMIKKIVTAADLTPACLVVEIGPGLGALTVQAVQKAGKVLAIELDRGLIPPLNEVLEGAGDVEIVPGDALKTDFDALVGEKTAGAFGRNGREYKVLGNLPYYITSPLLMRLLTGRYHISLIIVMVQLEVAARLTAVPGTKEYGSLSVAVQYFTKPEILFRVPGSCFFPPPGVNSAVVRLAVRPAPAVTVHDEELFFKVVRAAFGQRRKTLLNSLAGSGLLGGKDFWLQVLQNAGLDPHRRGETLTLAEFAVLTEKIK
jgi:16S rRNA (adenine1518-N6/adenine1519-N6)-dimethyltransferase